jgi:signal transduction histidine kinase
VSEAIKTPVAAVNIESPEQQARKSEYKKLFLREEFSGDKIINTIRFALCIILELLVLVKAGLFSGLVVSKSLIATTILISIAMLYTVILFFLYRKEIYHPFIKFVSQSIDMLLIIFALFVYKLEPMPEYAKIYFLARYAIAFIFIIMSILRYNFWVSLYAGIISAVAYVVLVIMNNHMTGMEFTFIGPDGSLEASVFDTTEAYFKVAYLFIAGLASGLIALKIRNLVITSVNREQDKSALETKNTLIEAVNQENRKYLDNINEGLLLIDREFTISEQYSGYLVTLFNTVEIAGFNFIDFIYPDKEQQSEERTELGKFLDILFNNTLADFDMIMDVNPLADKTITVEAEDGRKIDKIINASYYRIEEMGSIANIMIIFEDRTDIIKAQQQLEDEKQRYQSEIESISAILKIGPRSFADFIGEADRALSDVELQLESLDESAIVNHIFRQMHSLKGSARTFGFRTVADTAHQFEDILAKIRDNKLEVDYHVKKDLRDMVTRLVEDFYSVKRLYDRFKDFSTIEQGSAKNTPGSQLMDFINTLEDMTDSLSRELDKEIKFIVHNNIDSLPCLDQLKNPLIHLVRNAIDHGIEDRYERLSNNKEYPAKILLTFNIKDGNYVIDVIDDGGGINFDNVRKSGIKKGLLSEKKETSKVELLQLLFSPGYSSRDEVTDLSGRGVGLDVVKDALDKLQGRISVNTEHTRGTRFSLKVPVKKGV